MWFRGRSGICILSSVLCASVVQAIAENVSVTVTVKDVQGSPITGIPITIMSNIAIAGGETGADGSVVVPIEVEATVGRLRVDTCSYGWSEPADSSAALARMDKILQMRKQYALPVTSAIQMVAWQTAYAKELTAVPAIEISCKHTDQQGNGLDCIAWSSTSYLATADASGVVKVNGIPIGQSVRLFAGFADGRVVERTGGPFMQNADLGNMVIDTAADAKIKVSVADTSDSYPERVRELYSGVTLISTNGQYIKSSRFTAVPGEAVGEFVEVLSSSCSASSGEQQSGVLCVPAGTYWLVPGCFGPDSPSQIAMLDIIRAGQPIGAAGIGVTAVASSTIDLNVNTGTLIKGWLGLGLQ